MANHLYRAFGRTVSSFVRLPAPEVGGGKADWDLTLGDAVESVSQDGNDDIAATVVGGMEFAAPGFANFDIRGGEVNVHPAAGMKPEDLVGTLTGTLSALLLAREGELVLHGTTLRRGNSVYIICGNAGAGKSTQAAYLACNGWELFADDVASMDVSGVPLKMHRGFSSIRLFPDSLRLLGLDAERYPRIYPQTTKRMVQLGADRGDEVDEPVRVGGVVVLDVGESFDSAVLTPREAMVSLLKLQHPTAAQVYDATAEARVRSFAACSRLAQSTRVICIRRAKTAENLRRVAEAIGGLVN